MAIEINKGIEAFDERIDFSRNNTDRKPWGRSGMDNLDVRSEYDTPTVAAEAPKPTAEPPAVPEKKFTHKLSNGTVLEAATVEELAQQIEKAATTPSPAPQALEFEDKPLYQPIEFKRKELSLQDQANILNLWKENPQKALRQLEEAEYGVSMDVLLQNLSRAELRELHRQQEIAGAEFLEECVDYRATPTNAKKLTGYLAEQNKPITKNNLKVAFQRLVQAGDKNLLIEAQPEVPTVDETLDEVPPPPVIVPSNQGTPPTQTTNAIDPAKFAALPLDKQKEFFRNLKRA